MLARLMVLIRGLLLNSGMRRSWLPRLREHPCVWTDGGQEACPTWGFEVAGAGVYLAAPEMAIQGAAWEMAEEYGDAGP